MSETPERYAGADWLQENLRYIPDLADKTLSPLARVVADILGQAFAGLYHIPDIVRQQWFECWGVEVLLSRELATWDGCELTTLVMLCHDAAVRLSVDDVIVPYRTDEDAEGGAAARQLYAAMRTAIDDPELCCGSPRLRLHFSQRQHGPGRLDKRHPTLNQAAERCRRLGAAVGIVPPPPESPKVRVIGDVEFSAAGIPVLTLAKKLEALAYCLKTGHDEDACGHLCDLLWHVGQKIVPSVGEKFPDVQALAAYYGKNVAPIKE